MKRQRRDLRVEKKIIATTELKSESQLRRWSLPQRLVMVVDEVRGEGEDHEMRLREDERDWRHWTSKRDMESFKESMYKGMERKRRSP